MPEFAYRAMDQRRRWLRGHIRAISEFELDQRLRDRGLDLVTCKTIKASQRSSVLSKGIQTRDLVQLCIHLEQMGSANVPLMESLAEARDSVKSGQLQDIITEIHRDVSEGMALSAAFAVHPEVFDSVFSSLIAAGEETGNMTESFKQLVSHLKWAEALRSKIKKATRYPMILGFAVVAAAMFMMIFVVPQVVGMLEAIGQDLPGPTIALIAVSEAFQSYWYLILSVPFGLFIAHKAARRASPAYLFKSDFVMLRSPVIGDLIKKISFARFAQIFAVTFQSGVPVLGCIDTGCRTIENKVLIQAIEVMKDQVQAGEPMSEAMTTTGEFPAMVVHMVKVGEDSGKLADTLWNIAEFYNRDVDQAVDNMISMIEPALIAVMGGMISWVALAVFVPLYGNLGSLNV
jgi:type IV pilus assembly protein PilC